MHSFSKLNNKNKNKITNSIKIKLQSTYIMSCIISIRVQRYLNSIITARSNKTINIIRGDLSRLMGMKKLKINYPPIYLYIFLKETNHCNKKLIFDVLKTFFMPAHPLLYILFFIKNPPFQLCFYYFLSKTHLLIYITEKYPHIYLGSKLIKLVS